MAKILRRIDPMASVVADLVNQLKAQIGAGSDFHLDKSEVTVTAADGDGTADVAIALANDIMNVYQFHLADTLAHKVADAPPALTKASSLATAITLANAIKADYTTHRASTTYHYNADGTNAIAAANATDQASLDTLLNELKGDINLHMAGGPSAPSVRLLAG